jgi:hypothetical protein
MMLEGEFGNWPPADEMFLNDAFEHRRITVAVPSPFRVHDRNRTTLADAEAVGFGAKDAAPLRELQLFEATLQKIPRRDAPLLVAAFGFGLIAAKKNVAPGNRHTNAGRDLSLGIAHAGSIFNACSEA